MRSIVPLFFAIISIKIFLDNTNPQRSVDEDDKDDDDDKVEDDVTDDDDVVFTIPTLFLISKSFMSPSSDPDSSFMLAWRFRTGRPPLRPSVKLAWRFSAGRPSVLPFFLPRIFVCARVGLATFVEIPPSGSEDFLGLTAKVFWF